MTFGQVLQKIRRSKAITQRQIASIIGMDFSYYSKLENDRLESRPTRETIDKIAEALECNLEGRNELLAAAGRATDEMEQASRIARDDPKMGKSLGKLFRAAVQLTPERLEKLAERVEREQQKVEGKTVKRKAE